MRKTVLIAIGAAVGLVAAYCVYLWTAQWDYDPRPLMDRLRRRNAGSSDAAMHFLVFGDAKLSSQFPRVLRRADSLAPDFCLTTGDLVPFGGGVIGKMNYQALGEQAGWFLRKYPTWPTLGNHELGGGDDYLANFSEFFGIETADYSFTYQNAKFIALGWGEIESGPRRLRWLEQELSNAAGKHLFVFLHRPFYTVGTKSYVVGRHGTAKVAELFGKYSVVAVFSGDDHIYYRTRREGVHYVISGGAGAEIYALEHEREAVEGDVYYGAEVNAHPAAYRFHFAGGRPDATLQRPIFYVVSVKISGEEVSLQMIDAAGGKVWDEAILRNGKTKPAGLER